MKRIDIDIKRIDVSYAEELSKLLAAGEKEYSQYFIPFEYDVSTIKKLLSEADENRYFGIFTGSELVGFYMLRGFDAGYQIPSYGVWISQKYSGKGLGKLTLQHAISFCKINGIKKLMLKVHPSNTHAKELYERSGFSQTGVDPKIGHLIYHKEL